MNPPSRGLQWIVWGALGLTVALIVASFVAQRRRGSRPAPPPPLFEVAPFTLTNQAGRAFDTASLSGQVWIADIIFTRCPGPCARMTRRMAELQAAIPATQPVRFLTLTTDPEFDTPAVLDQYARRFNADPARWHFLTGTKSQIAAAAVHSLKLTVKEQEPAAMTNPNDLFIHSTIFVIVDRQARVRAVIETEPGEEPPPEESLRAMVRTHALPIIEQLLKE